MCDAQSIWQCDRVIASRTADSRGVQEEVLRQLQRHRWTEREIFGVRLAMEEALVNAIKHGNRSDASKQIRVACRLWDGRLRIEITDEGTGFDPGCVPDPTEPKNLEAPGGRGILLMRTFMTHVEYNKQGNTVILEKQRTGCE